MPLISGHFYTMLAIFVGFIMASLILKQRRSPMSATAWMVFVVVAPYVAVPAFLIFGLKRRFTHSAVGVSSRKGETVGDDIIDQMLDRYEVPPGTGGNDFRLISDSVEAEDALHETVGKAEKDLRIVLFSIEDDEVGIRFADALTEKAKSGVKVRLLLDSVGSFFHPKDALKRLEDAGGEVRFFAPLLHGPFGPPINERNHRKIVIADETWLWSGGRNVGSHYMGDADHVWSDLTFLSEGPVVDQFVELHKSDWEAPPHKGFDFEEPKQGKGASKLRFIPAGSDQTGDALHDLLVTLCHRADRRIWIATPYFIPTDALWDTLTIACRRGIEVRILTPEETDQTMANLVRGPFMRELDEQGADILLHHKMLHAKCIIIDDLAFVGSANFDARSLLLNYEATVMLETESDIKDVVDWYTDLADKAKDGPPATSRVRRSLERVLQLVAPVL